MKSRGNTTSASASPHLRRETIPLVLSLPGSCKPSASASDVSQSRSADRTVHNACRTLCHLDRNRLARLQPVQVRIKDHPRNKDRREQVGQQDRRSASPQIPSPARCRTGTRSPPKRWWSRGYRRSSSRHGQSPGPPPPTAALPARTSSRMRSKISTFESTPMPIVRITPAMPGSVSVRLAEAHEAQQNHQVQKQRQIRVDARAAIIERA